MYVILYIKYHAIYSKMYIMIFLKLVRAICNVSHKTRRKMEKLMKHLPRKLKFCITHAISQI